MKKWGRIYLKTAARWIAHCGSHLLKKIQTLKNTMHAIALVKKRLNTLTTKYNLNQNKINVFLTSNPPPPLSPSLSLASKFISLKLWLDFLINRTVYLLEQRVLRRCLLYSWPAISPPQSTCTQETYSFYQECFVQYNAVKCNLTRLTTKSSWYFQSAVFVWY